jgi:CheY-like chemotaxis protein
VKGSPTVLLAEDNPDHQYVTRMLLEECGCRVIEAMNGVEAVELALSQRPDMILLDLKMPVLGGIDAALRIRKEPEMRKVPMVAYSAYYSYSLTEGAHAAGFDEYIKKPVELEEMEELIDRYFPERRKGGSR